MDIIEKMIQNHLKKREQTVVKPIPLEEIKLHPELRAMFSKSNDSNVSDTASGDYYLQSTGLVDPTQDLPLSSGVQGMPVTVGRFGRFFSLSSLNAQETPF